MPTGKSINDLKDLEDRFESLEKRLRKIESILRVEEWKNDEEEDELVSISQDGHIGERAESGIVEYGLAWLGSIVFVFGIIFLMSYTEGEGHFVLSKIVAYFSTFLLLAIAYYLRNPFPILANVLNICSSLLLYYVTVKLYFFTEQALVSSKWIVVIGLLVIVGVQIFKALKKDSQFYGTLALLLVLITAVISDAAYITFPLLVLAAIGSTIILFKKNWWNLQFFSLFFVYTAHLLWLFGNPILGNPMQIVEAHHNSLIFLFSYVAVFALTILISRDRVDSNLPLISISIWNVLYFSILLIITIVTFYQESNVLIFGLIAFICLLYAVILKVKSDRDFAPGMYACFGFMSMSVAVYSYAGLPSAFLLLALQSFLVVSMALWFRSKIIVVANSLLFFVILLFYLITSESINSTNFVFALTALATARILGWQKERLTLKTEVFRNMYLLVTCFMILFGLNHAIQSNYVTLSWTATAIGFFLLSILLHNIKYRYLSILTFVITGGHLFFVDLGQMDMGYRVIAFLVFAIISLGVSLYYTRRIDKK